MQNVLCFQFLLSKTSPAAASETVYHFSWKMSEQCPEAEEEVTHPCNTHPLRAPFASTQCDILKSDLFKVYYFTLYDFVGFIANKNHPQYRLDTIFHL